MSAMERITCKDTLSWRSWLQKNHITKTEIWLVFYKGEKGNLYINHDQALDEALCFGWIDNMVKRIDDEKYALRFTRRKEKSNWTSGNKARVKRLIEQKRMAPAGYAVVEAAKANGSWNAPKSISK
jgi:uncharacterized protein YdeI (YjbR/CyaY-like superfamily)